MRLDELEWVKYNNQWKAAVIPGPSVAYYHEDHKYLFYHGCPEIGSHDYNAHEIRYAGDALTAQCILNYLTGNLTGNTEDTPT